MAKGVIVAHAVHAEGGPGFITGTRRERLKPEIPDRLWTFTLNNAGAIHILRCWTAAHAPLTITPGVQTLGVWIFSCSNIRAARARRILRAVKDAATEVLSIQELRDDGRAVAATVRASPDVRRVIGYDANGDPNAWDTYLTHTVFGHGHPVEADGTTAAEIDNATPEPLSRARPR